jgi:RimJ/RimL family protein N-acetyltransferase
MLGAGADPAETVGAQVELRPAVSDDIAVLRAWSAAEDDVWSPLPSGWSGADWRDHLAAAAGSTLVIEHAGRPAGVVMFGPVDVTHRVVELAGYWLAPLMRGRGIGRSAIELAARHAFDRMNCARVQIFTRPDNVASRRAAVAAGFAEEGLLRSFVEVSGERSDAVVLSRIESPATTGPSGMVNS